MAAVVAVVLPVDILAVAGSDLVGRVGGGSREGKGGGEEGEEGEKLGKHLEGWCLGVWRFGWGEVCMEEVVLIDELLFECWVRNVGGSQRRLYTFFERLLLRTAEAYSSQMRDGGPLFL